MSSLATQIKLRRAATSERKQGCYSIKEGISAIRIKAGTKNWIFPWLHHVFSLREEEEIEQLLLTFASHEVSITGYNLAILEEDIANHRVEKLRYMPANYVPTYGEELVVTKIEVKLRGENEESLKIESETQYPAMSDCGTRKTDGPP